MSVFTQYDNFLVHLCCCKWHYSVFFMTEYYSVDIFFNSYSVDGHLGCFHALDIVNCAAMNKVVHMSF